MLYRNLWKDHANGLIISRGVMCFLQSEGNKGLCWFSSYCTLLCVMDFYSQSSPFGITYKDLKSVNLIVVGSLHAAKKMQNVIKSAAVTTKVTFRLSRNEKTLLENFIFDPHSLKYKRSLLESMIVEKVCQIMFNPLKVLKLLFSKPVKTSFWGFYF